MPDDTSNKANPTPVVKTAETKPEVPQKADVVLPTPPKPETTAQPVAAVPSSGNVAPMSLSHEEQALLLQKHKRAPLWVILLKYISLLLMVIGIVGVIWLKADLDPTNQYLSLLNATENTGARHERLGKMKKKMEQESLKYTSKIARINQQLMTKNYSVYTENIQEIRGDQLVWFDTVDKEGNMSYGILDGPQRAAEYFNSKLFANPILSNTGNEIQVGDVSSNRTNINFGVRGSHIFGKAFFLNTEFVSLMNAFPIYKDGILNSFTKKEDKDGTQSMDFVLQLFLQSPDEDDPHDNTFIKYEKWLQALNTKKQ